MATQARIDTPKVAESPTPEVRSRQRSLRVRIPPARASGLALATIAILAIWVVPSLIPEPPADLVQASGRIEGREVTLAAKEIQGRVKNLLVDEGHKVRKKQLLAELESQQLDARFQIFAANLAQIDAQIEQASIEVELTTKTSAASIAAAEAVLSATTARLQRSRAVLANHEAEYKRLADLFRQGIISRSLLDHATMNHQTSAADVDAAEKDLAHARASLVMADTSRDMIEVKRHQLHSLRELRRAAEAQLAEAQANIEERMIYAPVDGTILSRTVEVGDVANPGSPIFVMVDMSRLYLKVYVPEPDIPKLKLGDPADVTVDAFPGRTFPARITKIYEEAEFTPKNVETREERVKLVFGVELGFVDPDPVLKPGMPADCIIRWKNE